MYRILFNTEMDADEIELNEDTLSVYINIARMTNKIVTDSIRRKEPIVSTLIAQLKTSINEMTIIYHSFADTDDEIDMKYDFGIALQDLKSILYRIERYMYKKKRCSASEEAKVEAYQDPVVAAYAETSTGGIKTRNGFYKRKV